MKTNETKPKIFDVLSERQFNVVSNKVNKTGGFRLWLDAFHDGTRGRPKASIRLEPLGDVHRELSLRVNLCQLASLKVSPDGAAFIDNPGDFYINADSEEAALSLADALVEAGKAIRARYGTNENSLVVNAAEITKETKPDCAFTSDETCATETVHVSENLATIMSDKFVISRDRGDGELENHGFNVEVGAGKWRSDRTKTQLTIEALGDVYQECDLQVEIDPLTFVEIANSKATVRSPGRIQITLSSEDAAITLAGALRKGADFLEKQYKKTLNK